MAIKTCFLPHFPRTLQGRPKQSQASRLARGLQALRDLALPDLAALLGNLLPPEFFAQSADAQALRERIYPPVTVFWAFLFQVLNPAMACQEVVGKVRAWMISRPDRRQRPALGTSAYCEARSALNINLLKAAFEKLASYLDSRAPSTWLWCGRRVKVLDGSTYSMPDTPANQSRWPQPSQQKKGCGFPVAKILGVFCLSTGGWLGYGLSKLKCHDLRLWNCVSYLLVQGDVLVGDAGFSAYALMAELKARQVDTAFRLHQMRSKDMRRGKKLGKDDRLQIWNKPSRRPPGSPWKTRAWKKLPDQIEVRVVRVRIERNGFRTKCLWIATTLTDPLAYPAAKIAELYYRRWSIELFLRDIKTTMHMEVLRTKSPHMIEKELFMHAIAYNAVRALILQSAIIHHQELGRISFKGAVDLLRQWLPQAAACYDQPRKLAVWHDELLEAIACVQNPLRPDRREPRAKKRRPKSYPLLTKPRHQFREIPHRSRYHVAA